jgi:hypothetical protein
MAAVAAAGYNFLRHVDNFFLNCNPEIFFSSPLSPSRDNYSPILLLYLKMLLTSCGNNNANISSRYYCNVLLSRVLVP